jgi:uncharacterized protein YdbL (DUF1318 family)
MKTNNMTMKNKINRALISVLVVISLSVTSFAWALELDQAKSRGLVGETPSGYLEPVTPSPDSEVRKLVDDINSKRRNQYIEISKKNNTTLAAVEALAGQKAIEKTASGNYIKTQSGWKKK